MNLNINIIDIVKMGLIDINATLDPGETIEDLTQGLDAGTLKDRISAANKEEINSGDNPDKIRADMVEALMSLKNIAQTSNLSPKRIDFVTNLAVLNKYFFADSPILNDAILLDTTFPTSEKGEGRKQFVDIIKLEGAFADQKKKFMGMELPR